MSHKVRKILVQIFVFLFSSWVILANCLIWVSVFSSITWDDNSHLEGLSWELSKILGVIHRCFFKNSNFYSCYYYYSNNITLTTSLWFPNLKPALRVKMMESSIKGNHRKKLGGEKKRNKNYKNTAVCGVWL